MNKSNLVKKIRAELSSELAMFLKAARTAHEEATDEESKAEDKYDTRGLEAAYLASGQSKQAAEIEQTLALYQSLALRRFRPQDPIDVTALVELDFKGTRTFYFLGPKAGGTEIQQQGHEVLVITPQSPLGQNLIGKKAGDRFKMKMQAGAQEYRVVSVK